MAHLTLVHSVRAKPVPRRRHLALVVNKAASKSTTLAGVRFAEFMKQLEARHSA